MGHARIDLVTAVLAAQLVGCASVSYSTTHHPTPLPPETHTFAIVGPVDPPHGYRHTPNTAAPSDRIANRMRDDLVANGYREVPQDQAELFVRYGLGVQHHGGPVGGGPPHVEYVEAPPSTGAAVVLEVLDAHSLRALWRGKAYTELLHDRAVKARLDRATDGLVDRFVAASVSSPDGR